MNDGSDNHRSYITIHGPLIKKTIQKSSMAKGLIPAGSPGIAKPVCRTSILHVALLSVHVHVVLALLPSRLLLFPMSNMS
jgi:hypothetical protein